MPVRSPMLANLLALTILIATPTFAQSDDIQESDSSLHKEKRHDPYLPTPPQPEGPHYPIAVVEGDFVSVQVNVDAAGNNIVGDAANETSIAVDPTDPKNMAIGWRQFSNVASDFRQAGVAYSQDGGLTWTNPGILQPGQFRSDPVLESDADGVFYYYSLSSLASAEFFRSTDGGATWSGPFPGFGGDKAWIAIDRTDGIGRGNVYAAWNIAFSCCNGDFTRSTDAAQSFLEPFPMPLNPNWGTLTVGPDGDLYISGVGAVVIKSSNAQDPNATPTFDLATSVNLGGQTISSQGPNPGGLLGQVWIATDHSQSTSRGNVYLLASVRPIPATDPLDVMFVRSTDEGQTWSDPIRVNDDPPGNEAWQWFGTMSVAPNGRIDAFWNDTRNTGVANLSQVYYSFSTDTGLTWSKNIALSPVFDSHVGWPQQAKLGDYYQSVSDNNGVNLAYAATFNGEQDVYFLRYYHVIGNSDTDADGDTDLADFAFFFDCVTGDISNPDYVPPTEPCENLDFDLDTDIDFLDFGIFQERFTGDCGVSIVSPPEDVTVCLGASATFNVTALGHNLTYQWKRDSVPIPGAVGPQLVIESTVPQSTGTYSAVVQSNCTATQSSGADLNLRPLPSVTDPPQSLSVCAGSDATFQIQADGVQPLRYQWRRNESDLPGAVSPVLFLESVSSNDEGQYNCRVTDGCDQFVVSATADLTLSDPVITTQPASADLCIGDNYLLFVESVGAESIQWSKNGEEIPGATQPFYVIAEATLSDQGVYRATLFSPCGNFPSENAIVGVACAASCPPCPTP